MDGFINSKIEKQTIYEIYRACRLCGAGAGYKMPIIQNVVHLDGAEVELKQKIRECVQIEVHQDDKMPPLICELCVDKVNDFYEFLEMCRHTNKRTRLRLGLPPQAMPRGAPDAGDCILGVTEPVFINDDSNEHLLRSKNKSNKSGKFKKDESKIISNNSSKRVSRDSRDSRIESRTLRSKQPSPPRLRGTKRYHEEEISLSRLQKSKKTSDQPKSILKKQEIKNEDEYLTPRSTRPRDRDVQSKREVQSKKVQILSKPLPPRSTRTLNTKSKSPPPPSHRCKTCKAQFDNYRSLSNHMRSHTYAKQTERKPIRKDSRDIKCTDCGKSFLSKTLLNIHKCSKQGGVCSNCNKHFYSQKSLIRHRSTCVQRKKEPVVSPKIRRMLKLLQIRVARCDPLLKNISGEHYDVSQVQHDYGLDKTCIYPYISSGLRIKFEPGYMVDINDDIRQAFDADKYVHWDSDDTDSDADSDVSRKVDSLTCLSLKTIFSQKFLGKIPRKRRKVKAEKAFDSILNISEFDTDLKRGIDNIIDSLDDKIDESVDKDDESFDKTDDSVCKANADKSDDNDSLFDDNNVPSVSNDDFDSLFNNSSNANDKEERNNRLRIESESNDKNVIENDINESTVKEDLNSKENIIEVRKDLNEKDEIDSNKNSIENIDNSNINSSLNDEEEFVNKAEKNVNEEVYVTKDTKINDSIINKKLNKESLMDNVENREVNTDVIDSDSTNVIINDTTKIENSKSCKYNDTNDKKVNISTVNDKMINENINKNNEIPIDRTDNILNENTNHTNEIREGNSANDSDKKPEHVNGESEDKFNIEDLEDLSEAEIDDTRLMEAIDAQIGENETEEKSTTSESDKKLDKVNESSLIKSADLESISDDEFDLNKYV